MSWDKFSAITNKRAASKSLLNWKPLVKISQQSRSQKNYTELSRISRHDIAAQQASVKTEVPLNPKGCKIGPWHNPLREQWAAVVSPWDQPTPSLNTQGNNGYHFHSCWYDPARNQTHNLLVSGWTLYQAVALYTRPVFLLHSRMWCDSIAPTIHMPYCLLLFLLYCWRRHILTLGIQVTFTAASAQDVHTFFYRPLKSSLLICAGCNLFVMGKSRWHAPFGRVSLCMYTAMSNGHNRKEGHCAKTKEGRWKKDHGGVISKKFKKL